MRSITIIWLLLLFATSQMGYYCVYIYKQNQIKQNAKDYLTKDLPDSIFEVIIQENFKDKIEWEKPEKEFSLNGKMYDVAKIKRISGQTYIYCISDKVEDKLEEEYVNIQKTNSQSAANNKNAKINAKFHQYEFYCQQFAQKSSFKNSGTCYKYLHFTPILVSSTTDIITPPPRLV